jgi:hypothetical protein
MPEPLAVNLRRRIGNRREKAEPTIQVIEDPLLRIFRDKPKVKDQRLATNVSRTRSIGACSAKPCRDH